MAVARLTDTLVFPTPPLPPVTAITCTGWESPSSLALLIKLSSGDAMGGFSESSSQEIFIGRGAARLGEPHCSRHQLERTGRAQILRHALSFAHVGHGQPCPDQNGQHSAEAGRCIEFGQYAASRIGGREML